MDVLHLNVENFLIPGIVTAVMGFLAASIKIYEYTRLSGHKVDFIMWIAILSRVGLGLVYLLDTTVVVSSRTVEIRFLITLLLLVECLRGLRKIVAWRKTNKAISQLGQLGWPENEH